MATVLIIEDEPDIADNLSDLLDALGHEALQAHDGEAGLMMARTHQPDLVLCDLRMPKRTGHEVLQAIRQDGAWGAAVPFAFLTASTEPALRSKSLDLGADAFIRKPFDVDQLLGIIQSLIDDAS